MKITVSVEQHRQIQNLGYELSNRCLTPADFDEEAWRIGLTQILGFEPTPGDYEMVVDYSTAQRTQI